MPYLEQSSYQQLSQCSGLNVDLLQGTLPQLQLPPLLHQDVGAFYCGGETAATGAAGEATAVAGAATMVMLAPLLHPALLPPLVISCPLATIRVCQQA